jgi:protein involved in sex pheromone biosynthesis
MSLKIKRIFIETSIIFGYKLNSVLQFGRENINAWLNYTLSKLTRILVGNRGWENELDKRMPQRGRNELDDLPLVPYQLVLKTQSRSSITPGTLVSAVVL